MSLKHPVLSSNEPSCQDSEEVILGDSTGKKVPIRAFMDDLTITARSIPEAGWMLVDLVELTNWTRMEFKFAKANRLVLRNGCVQDLSLFKIKKDSVKTVQEQPVKSSGKWYRVDLNKRQSLMDKFEEAEINMTSLEKSGFPSKYKSWGY